jgi:uncharacterized protein (TIGR03067 family)
MAVVAMLGLGLGLTARAAEDGFVSLFDGKSLEGWEGNQALWSVRDGAITGETKADTGLKHNTFLVWKGGAVENFELRLQYRVVKGNSGIQYRSRVVEQGPQGPIVGGYQADLEAGKTYSGIMYEERGRGILAERGHLTRVSTGSDGKHRVESLASVGKTEDLQAVIRDEDWNDYLIIARGNSLTHVINGRVMSQVIDDDADRAKESGVLALQVHAGPPMVVQFRDVRLKRYGGTTGLAAKTDQERMQGEWVGVTGVRDGEAIPAEWLSALRLTIRGDRYEVKWPDGGDTGSFQLTEAQAPRLMDVTSSGGSGSKVPGIYELMGDTLRVAYGMGGAPRPKDFRGSTGSESVSITYRRK